MKSWQSPSRRVLLALLFLAAMPMAALAGNQFFFFFPDFGDDPFSPVDDRLEVEAIRWEEDPDRFWIFRPGHPTTTNFTAVVPEEQQVGQPYDDLDILDAAEESLEEWNDVGTSSFDFDTAVAFTAGFNIPGNLRPSGTDGGIDGINLITFNSPSNVVSGGAIAAAFAWFIEFDLDEDDLIGPRIPVEAIDGFAIDLGVDLDEDEAADFLFEMRDYERGEIIDADVIFATGFPLALWPDDRDDIDDEFAPLLFGSADIQAVLTHELGHVAGVAHTPLVKPTMFPALRASQVIPGEDGIIFIPGTDPYDMRKVEYDDALGLGLLYPSGLGSRGEIQGALFEGNPQAVEAFGDAFVVHQPVFVGLPVASAPFSFELDQVFSSNLGPIQLLGQVFSGQALVPSGAELRYPVITGDIFGFDSIVSPPPFEVFFPAPGATVQSRYRFPWLTPKDDYVVYIDQSHAGVPVSSLAINSVYATLADTEATFQPEFYGTQEVFGVDTANEALSEIVVNDDLTTTLIIFDTSLFATPIDVFPGVVTSGINIVTNDPNFVPPPPTPPTARAVANPSSGQPMTTVTLDGSGSEVFPGVLTGFSWTQVAGPPVKLSDPSAVSPTFTPALPSVDDEQYVFQLKVTDSKTISAPDWVTVTIAGYGGAGTPKGPRESLIFTQGSQSFSGVPAGIGGSPASQNLLGISLPTSGRLRVEVLGSPELTGGSNGNDPNYHLSSHGSHVNGVATSGFEQSTITSSPVVTNAFTGNLLAGSHQIRITGPQALDPSSGNFLFGLPQTYEVKVYHQARGSSPVASAGSYGPVEPHDIVHLNGKQSSDADNDPLSYKWTQLSGPPVQLSHPNSGAPFFRAPNVTQPTELRFSLTVSDSDREEPFSTGLTSTSFTSILVAPEGSLIDPGDNAAGAWNAYE